MGRGGRGGSHQSFRRPADLTGVMSVAERNDLTTLVTAITEKIHNNISNIFDSPAVTPILGEQEHHNWLSLALFHRHEDSKENKPPSPPAQPKAAVVGDGSKTYKKAHQIVEKEETEAMTPQLRELKKEALLFFRKWQNGIIQRVREININDTAPPQGNPRGRGGRGSRGRGARGGGRNARGGLTLAIGKMLHLLCSSPHHTLCYHGKPNKLQGLPVFLRTRWIVSLPRSSHLSRTRYGLSTWTRESSCYTLPSCSCCRYKTTMEMLECSFSTSRRPSTSPWISITAMSSAFVRDSPRWHFSLLQSRRPARNRKKTKALDDGRSAPVAALALTPVLHHRSKPQALELSTLVSACQLPLWRDFWEPWLTMVICWATSSE